jgi:hypothetical protein
MKWPREEIELAAREVQSIKIERLHAVETLVATFGTKPNLQEARLRLRPKFRLDWAQPSRRSRRGPGERRDVTRANGPLSSGSR